MDDQKAPHEKAPAEKPPPGDKTVSLWEYLEKDEAAGGKTYRGSHGVEDKDEAS